MPNAACSDRVGDDLPPCSAWIPATVVVVIAFGVVVVGRMLLMRRILRRHELSHWAVPRARDYPLPRAETQLPAVRVKTTFDLVKVTDPPNADCGICLEPLWLRQAVHGPCEHVFHKSCISAWLARESSKASCPICRAVFQPVVRDPARDRANSRHFAIHELHELQFRDDAPV